MGGREEEGGKRREGEGGLVGYLYSYGIWGGVVRGYRGLNIYHLDTDTDTLTYMYVHTRINAHIQIQIQIRTHIFKYKYRCRYKNSWIQI